MSDVPDVWDRRVAGALALLRQRLTGDYEVDEFGFDRQLTESVFLPMLRPLYRNWFRIEAIGAKQLPEDGPALVVANHSGTIALDALMLAVAVHDEHPSHRFLRLLGADIVFRMPGLSEIARKSGGTLACNPDAERLLKAGELVGVFPEGFKGIGKPFADRYKLARFGRGGFVSAALRTGTPIIPLVLDGTYPALQKGDWRFGVADAEVRVLEPVETAGLTIDDVSSLRDRVRTMITDELASMRAAA